MTQDRGLQASYIVDGHGTMLGSSTKQQLLQGSQAAIGHRHRRGARGLDRRGSAIPKPAPCTALIQLQALNDAYLLVVRLVDPAGVRLLPAHQGAVSRI